jgi:outer membrane protein assembly factor BamB
MNTLWKLGLLALIWTLPGVTACASAQLASRGAAGVALERAPALPDGSEWMAWRGPRQDGTYRGPELPTDLTLGGPEHRWTSPLGGGGTPILSGSTLYAMGTRGEGEGLVEVLAALEADTGEVIWERRFPDFLSDIIYERYAIGSPALHGGTGNVYALTSAGLLVAHDANGAPLWSVSLMESFGRLTFPNGRTGSPVVVGDLVITRGITAAWGKHAPGRDRLLAFDALSGRLAWTSTPGERPIDSSFSTPIVFRWGGRVALLTGTGCGNLVAIDAANGELLWRKKISRGGVNATPVIGPDWVAVPHGKGRMGSSKEGGFVTFRVPGPGAVLEQGAVLPVTREDEQLPATSFTSSPVPVGDVLAQVTATGDVVGIHLGERASIRWTYKVGNENLHASPLASATHLYVPLSDSSIHVLTGDFSSGDLTSRRFELDGKVLGAPSASRGRLFIQTARGIHAYGSASGEIVPGPAPWPSLLSAPLPAELHVRPGDTRAVHVHGPVVDFGCEKGGARAPSVRYSEGSLTIDPTSRPGACALLGRDGAGEIALKRRIRLRVSPGSLYSETFESFDIGSRPPNWWLGAGKKWTIGTVDGSRVLEKTLGILLFQRATTLFGHPEDTGFTLSAKVRSDGNRRGMGSVGLVNQRYLIVLDGNRRELVVSSNYDRLHRTMPFRWRSGAWYSLKTRVDLDEAGLATIRVKAWPSDEQEPTDWTFKVSHPDGHARGASGVYGFSPQAQHKVYIDDIRRSPSEALATKGGS